MTIASTCGQLIVGGFSGPSLPASYAKALRGGRRGGAVLFASNLTGGPAQVAALARQVHAASASPLLAVDQEGGRVARLGDPVLKVPAMRVVASWNDVVLAERIARVVGEQLAAFGFTWNFAPVMDVDSQAENPVIGDRAFGPSPEVCGRFGTAWVRGLQSAGILATAKHFPGHGDTTQDSHLALPQVHGTRERLDAIEIEPFRLAAAAGVATMMTAHVVYPAIDGQLPATLSPLICTDVRNRIGFRGILVSDDLEMKAISDHYRSDEAAVLAVAAGCDALLVCHSESAQERSFEGLVTEAERSPTFLARCQEALERVMAARRRATARPLDDESVDALFGSDETRQVKAAIARRLSS
ncbi:MAG: beta-N-acetylhexosaminidase [Polyangiaceae bacterium]|jgi:beta-N-acetylhexosaminidase